jgi:arsenate reductase
MAGAWLNLVCPDYFEAGLEPGQLSPMAVEEMEEEGVDISGKQTKSDFDMSAPGMMFSFVITVCDGASAERRPIFPGITERLHWSFPDASKVTGSHNERLKQVREIRD